MVEAGHARQIEPHVAPVPVLPSVYPQPNFESFTLRVAARWIRVETMADPSLVFIAAVFLLAGLVKGVIGLGLPTISMGLLAVVMPPVHAAAILSVSPVRASLAWRVWGCGSVKRSGCACHPQHSANRSIRACSCWACIWRRGRPSDRGSSAGGKDHAFA
jgi:hypothetical protein